MSRGMDYFSIGTEFDAAWGKTNVAGMDLETPGPENKREIPCELPCEMNYRWSIVVITMIFI